MDGMRPAKAEARPEDHPMEKTEGLRDVAADLFLEVDQYSSGELQSERAAVRRKLDMIIMPM